MTQETPVNDAIGQTLMPSGMPVNPQAAAQLQLADIHLPVSPGLWPPAPGWWLLSLSLLVLLTWLAVKLRHYMKRKHQQRQIFRALRNLETQLKSDFDNQALASMNILLRRLALMHYPRKQIASLTGQDWLEFLDASGKTRDFTHGAGRVLADAPYKPGMPEDFEVQAFRNVVTRWVKEISISASRKQGAVDG